MASSPRGRRRPRRSRTTSPSTGPPTARTATPSRRSTASATRPMRRTPSASDRRRAALGARQRADAGGAHAHDAGRLLERLERHARRLPRAAQRRLDRDRQRPDHDLQRSAPPRRQRRRDVHLSGRRDRRPQQRERPERAARDQARHDAARTVHLAGRGAEPHGLEAGARLVGIRRAPTSPATTSTAAREGQRRARGDHQLHGLRARRRRHVHLHRARRRQGGQRVGRLDQRQRALRHDRARHARGLGARSLERRDRHRQLGGRPPTRDPASPATRCAAPPPTAAAPTTLAEGTPVCGSLLARRARLRRRGPRAGRELPLLGVRDRRGRQRLACRPDGADHDPEHRGQDAAEGADRRCMRPSRTVRSASLEEPEGGSRESRRRPQRQARAALRDATAAPSTAASARR